MEQNKKQKCLAENVATKLTDLIEYQEGAVVSRTILDKRTGTVTLFAFDRGEGLSEHAAPYDALISILDGEAEVTVSDKAIRVQQGEMFLIPAKKLHKVKATKRFKMVLTMIRS